MFRYGPLDRTPVLELIPEGSPISQQFNQQFKAKVLTRRANSTEGRSLVGAQSAQNRPYYRFPKNVASRADYGSGRHTGNSAYAVDFNRGGGNDDRGDAVVAAADGTVTFSGWDTTGFGNLVVIEHSNGERSYYAHMRNLALSANSTVGRGAQVGEVDNTGANTGGNGDFTAHLHFEIRDPSLPRNQRGVVIASEDRPMEGVGPVLNGEGDCPITSVVNQGIYDFRDYSQCGGQIPRLEGPTPKSEIRTVKMDETVPLSFTLKNSGSGTKKLFYKLTKSVGDPTIATLDFIPPVGGELAAAASFTVNLALKCLAPGRTTAVASAEAGAAGSGQYTVDLTCQGSKLGPNPRALEVDGRINVERLIPFSVSNIGNTRLDYKTPLDISPSGSSSLPAAVSVNQGTGVIPAQSASEFLIRATCRSVGRDTRTITLTRLSGPGGQDTPDRATQGFTINCLRGPVFGPGPGSLNIEQKAGQGKLLYNFALSNVGDVDLVFDDALSPPSNPQDPVVGVGVTPAGGAIPKNGGVRLFQVGVECKRPGTDMRRYEIIMRDPAIQTDQRVIVPITVTCKGDAELSVEPVTGYNASPMSDACPRIKATIRVQGLEALNLPRPPAADDFVILVDGQPAYVHSLQASGVNQYFFVGTKSCNLDEGGHALDVRLKDPRDPSRLLGGSTGSFNVVSNAWIGLFTCLSDEPTLISCTFVVSGPSGGSYTVGRGGSVNYLVKTGVVYTMGYYFTTSDGTFFDSTLQKLRRTPDEGEAPHQLSFYCFGSVAASCPRSAKNEIVGGAIQSVPDAASQPVTPASDPAAPDAPLGRKT